MVRAWSTPGGSLRVTWVNGLASAGVVWAPAAPSGSRGHTRGARRDPARAALRWHAPDVRRPAPLAGPPPHPAPPTTDSPEPARRDSSSLASSARLERPSCRGEAVRDCRAGCGGSGHQAANLPSRATRRLLHFGAPRLRGARLAPARGSDAEGVGDAHELGDGVHAELRHD